MLAITSQHALISDFEAHHFPSHHDGLVCVMNADDEYRLTAENMEVPEVGMRLS